MRKLFSIKQDEKYSLLGLSENAFNLINYTTKALKEEGLQELVIPYQKLAISGGHDNLIMLSQRYIDMANSAALHKTRAKNSK